MSHNAPVCQCFGQLWPQNVQDQGRWRDSVSINDYLSNHCFWGSTDAPLKCRVHLRKAVSSTAHQWRRLWRTTARPDE